MELHGVDLSVCVFHRGAGAVVGVGGHAEALGGFADEIRVAHPYDAALGDVLKKQAVRLGAADLDLSVFAFHAARDSSAGHISHQLAAVADAEDGYAEVKYRRVVVGRGLVVNGIGAAGEDYALVACGSDLLQGSGVAFDLGENAVIADTPGNKLVILSSEVEDEDLFM